jgi:hypothetical protein
MRVLEAKLCSSRKPSRGKANWHRTHNALMITAWLMIGEAVGISWFQVGEGKLSLRMSVQSWWYGDGL